MKTEEGQEENSGHRRSEDPRAMSLILIVSFLLPLPSVALRGGRAKEGGGSRDKGWVSASSVVAGTV